MNTSSMQSEQRKLGVRFNLLQFSLPITILLLAIVFTIFKPSFFTVSNFENVAQQASILVILAVGQAFPIISGGFDLSQGSIMALSSVLGATAAIHYGTIPGILIGILIGGLIGLVNGFLIAKMKVPPFIVTLGMLSFARGFAYVLTGGLPVQDVPSSFSIIGSEYIGPVPIAASLALITWIIMSIVANRTKIGYYTYAIGGNEEATRLSGVNTVFFKASMYIISGLLAGLAAMILSSRVNSGQPTIGIEAELQAIAAVVLGGVSLKGGQGSLSGVLMGVIILSILSNGLNLLNVSSYIQMMVIGAVIVLTTVSDHLRTKLK